MRYLACPGKFSGQSSDGIKVRWNGQNFCNKSLSCLYIWAIRISQCEHSSGTLLNCFLVFLKKPWVCGKNWIAREVWCPTSCEMWERAVRWNAGAGHPWSGSKNKSEWMPVQCDSLLRRSVWAVSTNPPRGDRGWRFTVRMQVVFLRICKFVWLGCDLYQGWGIEDWLSAENERAKIVDMTDIFWIFEKCWKKYKENTCFWF